MTTLPRPAAALAAILAIASLAACDSAPRAGGLEAATAAYRRGDFEAAERLGREAERSSHGSERAEAAYLVGLSAAKQGDLEGAARALRIAAASSDADLAGRANASLGAVEQALGDRDASRAAYRLAASSPDPLVAERAERLSGGRGTAARRSESAEAAARGDQGGFAVQAGAYSSESSARDRARAIAETARRAGYGEPRVSRISSRGGATLWAVQIGRFADRRQAGAARDRLGHPEWAIATVE